MLNRLFRFEWGRVDHGVWIFIDPRWTFPFNPYNPSEYFTGWWWGNGRGLIIQEKSGGGIKEFKCLEKRNSSRI